MCLLLNDTRQKGEVLEETMNSPKEIYQDLNHKDNVIKLSKFDCSRISVIIHCYSRFNERLKDSNLNILPYWSRWAKIIESQEEVFKWYIESMSASVWELESCNGSPIHDNN